MNLRGTALLIAAVSVISVLPDLLPKVWVWTQNPANIRYIGALSPFMHKCSETFQNVACEVEYRIPAKTLDSPEGKRNSSLGLGFFLTDYAIKCDNRLVYVPPKDFSASMVLDAYKVYKVADLSALLCSESADITILALNGRGIATHGQISANAVVGDRAHVAALKRAIEFLSSGIYLLIALVLLFSIFELKVLLRPLVTSAGDKEQLQYSGLVWAAFALFKSGLLEILFLTPTSVNLLFRIQTGISLVCHLQPLIESKDGCDRSMPRARLFLALLVVGYLPFLFTPYFNYYLVILVLCVSLVRFVTTAIQNSVNWLLLAFSACAALECLKALELKPLPTGSLTLALIWCVQISRSISAIRSAGILAEANLWSRKVSAPNGNGTNILNILRSFCEVVPIKQVTFFALQSSGDHLVYTYDKEKESRNEITPKHINAVPAGFGHIVSTGHAILHEHVSGEFFGNLFQREPIKEYGSHYSLVPIQNSKSLIGVAAIAKYEFDPDRNENDKYRVDAFLQPLAEALALANERRTQFLEDARFDKLSRLLNGCAEAKNSETLEGFFSGLLDRFFNEFGWKGFFGTFDHRTESLSVVCHNYPLSNGGGLLTGTHWIMKQENVRAPGPLALFKGERVVVANASWINELISENTKMLLKVSDTRSLAVVPVRLSVSGNAQAFGILWLSASDVGTFDSTFERSALLLQESLESEVYRLLHAAIESNLFSGQLRPDIHKRIMLGEKPVENGIGTLVQVDLANSSRIAKAIGPKNWDEYQQEYVKEVIAIAERFGLQAQMFIWDALFLTAPRVCLAGELREFSREFLTIATVLAKKYKVEPIFDDTSRSGRICVTHGDIGCGVTNAKWEINGQMLAGIKKFEESLKGKQIALAISHELFCLWAQPETFKEELIKGQRVLTLSYEDVLTSNPAELLRLVS